MPFTTTSLGAAAAASHNAMRRLFVPTPLHTFAAIKSSNHQPRRNFHASGPLRHEGSIGSDGKNHYETLGLHHTATHADIKKSFYKLSKAYHPDHNPSDPHASKRFMRLSEAYGVLGHADKRARYDREVMRIHHRPQGSHHSSGPAGGRPASGLSRRCATYQGPPPSFYRSGGWGAHGAKRRAAHEESTGTGSHSSSTAGSSSSSSSSSSAESKYGGMGPGQDPFYHSHSHHHSFHHFDREAHTRTHRREDERRSRRSTAKAAAKGAMGEADNIFDDIRRGSGASFLLVSGVILLSFIGPYLALGLWRDVKAKVDGTNSRRELRREREEQERNNA